MSKRRRFAMILLGLWTAYCWSYYILSRRGEAKARQYGSPFFYVPIKSLGPDSYGERWHFRLHIFYMPINYVDRGLFNGPTPCSGMTWGLSP